MIQTQQGLGTPSVWGAQAIPTSEGHVFGIPLESKKAETEGREGSGGGSGSNCPGCPPQGREDAAPAKSPL